MPDLTLAAPLTGWSIALDEVCDPAFASGLVGDGVAIDPIDGRLCAPCDGVVLLVAPTLHAVTLRAQGGAEVLLHIGVDTVALGGAGFTAHVQPGSRVRTGDLLISFDLDVVARRARSLVTPMVCIGERFVVGWRASGRAVTAGEPLMELVERKEEVGGSDAADADSPPARRNVVVQLPHGVHARPAAAIAKTARAFAARVRLETGARGADVRSSTALMTLALKRGDAAALVGEGPDAEAAVAAVAELLERATDSSPSPALPAPPAPTPSTPRPQGVLRGVTAAPGLAVGAAYRVAAADVAIEIAGRGPAIEQASLAAGRATARAQLVAAVAREHGANRAVLEAHLDFVDDPVLVEAAAAAISRGASAGVAWRASLRAQAQALRATGDARMAERVVDLADVEARVLRVLRGEPEAAAAPIPPGAILLADDLWPSQVIGLAPGAIAGFCTARGGPTSHVAILAGAMGVPALVAAGPGVLSVADGATLVLDADAGRLHAAPTETDVADARARIAARARLRAGAAASAEDLAITRDGVRIEVFANVGALAEAQAARRAGAEGVGLLRTEFLFLDRPTAPDEDEQTQAYQAVADAMEGRPVIVRTLDVGGDKPASYLPLPAEDNPALGLRGVRVSLWRPELLKTQLRAILRVRPVGQCRIMLPMVASLDEVRRVRACLDEARAELGVNEAVQLGAMVETPAAAVTADLLAAELDFLSIGTNDLTQYVLALDRGHPELASQSDALHPAVLRLVARTCEGARAQGRWTGACGGLASDLAATPILLGLGVTELSCTPAIVAEVKAKVRRLNLSECRALAVRALQATSAGEVRTLARPGPEEDAA